MKKLLTILSVCACTACSGGYDTPEEFYLAFEKSFSCSDDLKSVRDDFVFDDEKSAEFVDRLAKALAKNPEQFKRECDNWNDEKKLAETRSVVAGIGKFYIEGKTRGGRYQKIGDFTVIETDDGYRIKR